MAARPRTVPTPRAYAEFVRRVWKAETGKTWKHTLHVFDGRHMPGHCGVGGRSLYKDHKYYELQLKEYATCRVNPSDRWLEVQYVLLHELAHFLLPSSVNHEQVFYEKAYSLYVKYLPEAYLATVIKREVNYIPKYARPAAKRLKLEKYIQ